MAKNTPSLLFQPAFWPLGFQAVRSLADQVLRLRSSPAKPRLLQPLERLKSGFSHGVLIPPRLKFFNGLGGFSEDGREYVIQLKKEEQTTKKTIIRTPETLKEYLAIYSTGNKEIFSADCITMDDIATAQDLSSHFQEDEIM